MAVRIRRRREDDPLGTDHSDERVVDWKTVAPRWLLVALVFGGATWGSFSSMIAWNFYEAHEADKERRYSDWKGGTVADHEYRITTLERESKNNKDDFARLDVASKLMELKGDIREMRAEFRQAKVQLTKEIKEN